MTTSPTTLLASDVEWGTVPDWLTAVGALILGIGVALLGLYQWRREGFLPKVHAWLDSERSVVGIRVANAGRGKGHLDKIVILHERQSAEAETWRLTFPGVSDDGTWQRQALDGSDAVVLYALRTDAHPFPSENLKVQVWLGAQARITKSVSRDTHSYEGLTAQLPN